MKRFLLFCVACLTLVSIAGMANAAENKDAKKPSWKGFVSNRFADNWELQVGVGPSFMLRTGAGNIGDVTGFDVYIGAVKWFHPIIGARLVLEGGKMKYPAWNGMSTLVQSLDRYNYAGLTSPVKDGFLYLHPDMLINLSNWIGGYKERVYNLNLLVGAGLGVVFNDVVNKTWNFCANAGIQNRFNLGKKKAVSLDLTVQYVVTKSVLFPLAGTKSAHFNALDVFAGFTYRFNRRDWERSGATEAEATAMLARISNAEADAANAKAESERLQKLSDEQAKALAAANALLADREKALAEARKNLKPAQANSAKEAVAQNNYNDLLFYCYGMGTLSKTDKVRLDVLADQIKKDESGKTFRIEGFADPQTGKQKNNVKLSNKRAKLVYEYLLKKGVAKDKITFQGCGTDNLPFNAKEQNRVTVVY